MIPEAERATSNGLSTVGDTASLLSKAKNRLNEMAPKIEEDLKKAQSTAKDINKLLQDVQNQNIDFSSGKQLQNEINNSLDNAISQIGSIQSELKKLKDMNQDQQNSGNGQNGSDSPPSGNEQGGSENSSDQGDNAQNGQNQVLEEAIRRLETLGGALQEVQKNGGKITSFIEDKQQQVDSVITNLEELSGNTANKIGDFLKDYKETIEPRVKQEISQAQETLTGAKGILSEVQSTIPEVKSILANTENHIGKGQNVINTILGEFPYVNDKVNELADRIRDIQGDTDINEIIKLLQNNPEAERGFFPNRLN